MLSRAGKTSLSEFDQKMVEEHKLVLTIMAENRNLEDALKVAEEEVYARRGDADENAMLRRELEEAGLQRQATETAHDVDSGILANMTKKLTGEEAIGVYENEVISALEEHMDSQGDEAHHVQVALREAAHIVRGETTEDERTSGPCPQCKMTYGRHKMDCTDAPDFPLRSVAICGPRDVPAVEPHDKYKGMPAHEAAGWRPDDDGVG